MKLERCLPKFDGKTVERKSTAQYFGIKDGRDIYIADGPLWRQATTIAHEVGHDISRLLSFEGGEVLSLAILESLDLERQKLGINMWEERQLRDWLMNNTKGSEETQFLLEKLVNGYLNLMTEGRVSLVDYDVWLGMQPDQMVRLASESGVDGTTINTNGQLSFNNTKDDVRAEIWPSIMEFGMARVIERVFWNNTQEIIYTYSHGQYQRARRVAYRSLIMGSQVSTEFDVRSRPGMVSRAK